MLPHASLVRSVPPSVGPVSLAEAREHCRVTAAEDDLYLDRLVDMAVEYLDGKGALGRAIITQTWQQWSSATPGEVRALMTPFQTLQSVHFYNEDGVLTEGTVADLEAIGTPDQTVIRPKPGRNWPAADSREAAIRLTYTAGYGNTAADVPATIRHAILMMVAHWYERRETVAEGQAMELPYAARDLLSLERMSWYG